MYVSIGLKCRPQNEGLNPLTHRSDWLLISPYFISFESNAKVSRIKEIIITVIII